MIHVFVTMYNTGHLLGRCVESLVRQTTRFKCYIIDDCSTDDSASVADSLSLSDGRLMTIRNERKLYQCGCYDFLMREMDIHDDDVCVAVDSDDYLLGTDVFDLVKAQYAQGCLLTHGTFVKQSGAFPGQLVPPYSVHRLRRYTDVPSHLRTWKASLWRRMPPDTLKSPSGAYWKAGGDLAFMYTMMEIAYDKIGFIEKPIYCYDDTLPSCNHHKNPGIQKHNDHVIRGRSLLPKMYQ
jgi:glycosyltransferase involved in cell wall biosynthesis